MYASLEYNVSSSNLEVMFMGSVVFFICSASYVLYSDGYAVKHVVLSALRMRTSQVRLFICVCFVFVDVC